MKTLLKYTIIVVILFATNLLAVNHIYAAANEKLPTYFHYHPSALLSLKKLSSSYEMTADQLRKWDIIMFDLIEKNKITGIPASRIYAYVYIAQRDVAFLSRDIKQQFIGSLEPVSSKVLCLFFPNDCRALAKKTTNDSYSDKLANIVLEKIKLRVEADKKQSRMYPQKLKGKNYWSGEHPYVGQDTGSAKTWLISSPNTFLPPSPPAPQSKEWQNQLTQVKEALKNITPQQIKSIHYWAGGPGTITSPGIWLDLANKYMDIQHTEFAKRVLVRSVLSMGIADSMIAVFHAKYTYWVRRPFMLDHSIHTVIPTPNHPSYPAGHASLSATAATILSYYFPEKKQEWSHKANEASNGRVWGAIHFPIDIEQGLILGKKIGKTAINSASK